MKTTAFNNYIGAYNASKRKSQIQGVEDRVLRRIFGPTRQKETGG
jgi:hypothetical protein